MIVWETYLYGITPITDYCQVYASNIYLTGPLNISFTGGYMPHAGDRFVLLSYTTRTGDFSAVTVAPLEHGYPLLFYKNNVLHLWVMERLFIPVTIK